MPEFVLDVARTTVQDDRINRKEATDSEGDLVHWKRVIVALRGKQGDHQFGVEVRLDLRARLMQVTVENTSLTPKRVATTIVHHMCRFAYQAKADLFVCRPTEHANVSEWIVSDGAHVSGLLHRLKEAGTLDEQPNAPIPPALEHQFRSILVDIKGNLSSMNAWNNQAVTMNNQMHGLTFPMENWDLNGERVLRAVEDPEIALDLTTFFEGAREYAVQVPRALDNWSQRPTIQKPGANSPVASTWSFFTNQRQTIEAAGNRLVRKLGQRLPPGP